jgi:hypothetical protein
VPSEPAGDRNGSANLVVYQTQVSSYREKRVLTVATGRSHVLPGAGHLARPSSRCLCAAIAGHSPAFGEARERLLWVWFAGAPMALAKSAAQRCRERTGLRPATTARLGMLVFAIAPSI